AGVTADEREAERLASGRAEVVVAEVSLAPGSGLALARRIGERTPVLIVTRRHPGDVLLDAVDAGASGCAGHDTAVRELASLIERAAAGGFAVDPDRLPDALRRIAAARTERGDGAAAFSAL